MKYLDLGGEWDLQQQGTPEKIPAAVPGCVHTDLLNAKKIDDPFYADNEQHLMWIADKGWVYSRTFSVDREFLKADEIRLVCNGLDTLATVKINGNTVLTMNGMPKPLTAAYTTPASSPPANWNFTSRSSAK